jgi:hypothetical protein
MHACACMYEYVYTSRHICVYVSAPMCSVHMYACMHTGACVYVYMTVYIRLLSHLTTFISHPVFFAGKE